MLDKGGTGEVDVTQIGTYKVPATVTNLMSCAQNLPYITSSGDVMREMRSDITEEEVDQIIQRLDINGKVYQLMTSGAGDGRIDFHEFYTGFSGILVEQQKKMMRAASPSIDTSRPTVRPVHYTNVSVGNPGRYE